MTLPLASLASFLLVATGLTIFGLALRKASQLMAHARLVVGAVAACSSDLDRALAALAAEREICEKLEASLDIQLRHGRKTYKALRRGIEICEQARAGLETKAGSSRVGDAAARPAGLAADRAPNAAPRKLPAFVHRTVKSMHAA